MGKVRNRMKGVMTEDTAVIGSVLNVAWMGRLGVEWQRMWSGKFTGYSLYQIM